MQARAFVPTIPLQPSTSFSASVRSSTDSSASFTSSCRRRLRSSTSLQRPVSYAALSLIDSDNAASSPSAAEWLRANEAALRTSKDAVRVGYVGSDTAPMTIPLSSKSSVAPLASSPPRTSRPAVPSVAPRVSIVGHVFDTSPPSYCTVGAELDHVVSELDAKVLYLGPVARNKVVRAVELARASAVPSAVLAENITVALIVADLQMDCDTVCAAVLRTIAGQDGCSSSAVEHQVGADVLKILEFHAQLEESVRLCVDASFTELSFANLRELILVRAVEEHRAISLELARAVLAIRTVDALTDEQSRLAVARRSMYLYAPLANQLGIWFVQSELEELAFMYLDPQSFEMIRHLVGERRRECEDVLAESKRFLERVLSQTSEVRNLIRTVRIKGRIKGLYSVYRKMQRSGKKVYEIYDLLALRVVVQAKRADDEAEKAACYAVSNVIEDHYETFKSRAKNYIASPKPNGYRSMHMTVLPHGGSTPLEIQIRSEKMHHVAEFGAAAHWIYKEESLDEDQDAPDKNGPWCGSSYNPEDDTNGSGGAKRDVRHSIHPVPSRASMEGSSSRMFRHGIVKSVSGDRISTRSTTSSYPRPRIALPVNAIELDSDGQCAEEKMRALARERQSTRRRIGQDDLQQELRGGYVTCLASAIRASRVIVATAGQLYGLAVGSTLLDLASGLGVATLGAIAIVNDKVVPLTQRLEMNDIVRFIQV